MDEPKKLLRDLLREPVVQGLIVVAVLVAIVTIWILATADNNYTTADCIRQWHDVGVYARAEELCE